MPAKRRSFAGVVKAAEGSLRAARVEHVFVGGLAVAAFGVPRTTDVDVIVDYREEDAPRLAESFHRRSFQVSAEDLRDAHVEGGHCTIHDTLSGFRVDIAPALRIPRGHRSRDAAQGKGCNPTFGEGPMEGEHPPDRGPGAYDCDEAGVRE